MAKSPTRRPKPSGAKEKDTKTQPVKLASWLEGFVTILWHDKPVKIRLYTVVGTGYEIRIEDEGMSGPPGRHFSTLSKDQVSFFKGSKSGILKDPDLSILPQEIIEDLGEM